MKLKHQRLLKGSGTVAICAAALLGSLLLARTLRQNEAAYVKFVQEKAVEDQRVFEALVEKIVKNGRTPEGADAVDELKKLLDANKGDAARRETLLAALMNLYCWKMENAKDKAARNAFAAAAERYIRELELHAKGGRKSLLARRLASILMDQKRWSAAAAKFRDMDTYHYQFLPQERWMIWCDWARCLYNDGQYAAAIRRLQLILDESNIPELNGRVRRLLADYMLRISRSAARLSAYNSQLEARTDTDSARVESVSGPDYPLAPATPAALRSKAFELYDVVASTTPPTNPDSQKAMLAQLRILVEDGRKDEAYALANRIQSGGANSNNKAKSLILIANMETAEAEAQGKAGNAEAQSRLLDKAAETLAICKQRYPNSSTTDLVTYHLFNILMANKYWEDAFSLAEDLAATNSSKTAWMERIVSSFLPAEEGFPVDLPYKTPGQPGRNYLPRALALLDRVASNPDSGPDLAALIEQARAYLYFYAKDFAEAERRFAVILAGLKGGKPPEPLLHHDLLCASALGKGPAVSAYRARTYLRHYKKEGANFDAVMQTLLSSYYAMGLYSPALDIAKDIFIEQVSQFGAQGKPSRIIENLHWLRTVATIGQCYAKLGQLEQANAILRNYAVEFLATPFAAEVYRDWADVARRRGQTVEALRRLNIALDKAAEPSLRLSILLDILRIGYDNGLPSFLSAAETYLDELARTQALGDAARPGARRDVYELMLTRAAETDPAYFEALLERIMREYKFESWPAYWALRYVTMSFGKKSLAQISGSIKRLLETDYLKTMENRFAYDFLQRQFAIIQTQLRLDEKFNKLKERGL